MYYIVYILRETTESVLRFQNMRREKRFEKSGVFVKLYQSTIPLCYVDQVHSQSGLVIGFLE